MEGEAVRVEAAAVLRFPVLAFVWAPSTVPNDLGALSTRKADLDEAPYDELPTPHETNRSDRTRTRPRASADSNGGRALDLLEIRRSRCVDLVYDYVSWREACGTVAGAYENWMCAGPGQQKLAFSQYVAALNCQEQACDGRSTRRGGSSRPGR
jgi:hypothetical protein